MPIHGQNNGILKTIRFENIGEHLVKFENNLEYLNRKNKIQEHSRVLCGPCS